MRKKVQICLTLLAASVLLGPCLGFAPQKTSMVSRTNSSPPNLLLSDTRQSSWKMMTDDVDAAAVTTTRDSSWEKVERKLLLEAMNR